MHRTEVDIWQARARLGQQLLRWGGLLSLAIGLALIALSDHRFLGGLGTQTALWGLIDAVIAWLGIRSARHVCVAQCSSPAHQQQARQALRRTLWINTALDVVYVIGGLVLASSIGRRDSYWRGSGLGIAIQGGFLLIFDALHALSLRPAMLPDGPLGNDNDQ